MVRRRAGIRAVALALLLGSAAPARGATPAPPDTALAHLVARVVALHDDRHYAAADSVAGLAIARAEHGAPVDSSVLARLLFLRGDVRYALGQLGDTLGTGYFVRSIRIEQRMSRPDTARWVQASEVLSRVLGDSDLPDSALAVLARARALCQPSVAGADSMRSDLLVSTGGALARADRDPQALAAFDSALVIRVRLHGERHLSVAEVLSEEGALLSREDRLEESERLLERAIAIDEQLAGPMTSALVRPLGSLATAQFHAGDIARSIETLERILAIQAHASGPDSPRMIPSMYNIGLRLIEVGDFAGAYRIFAPLVPRAEAGFGVGNGRTESVRRMAGSTALEIGDTAAAALYLVRARTELQSRPLDENHNSNLIERDYARLLLARGDVASARRAVTEGLARERATHQVSGDAMIQLLDEQATLQMRMADSLGVDSTVAELAARFGDRATVEGEHYAEYLRVRTRAEIWLGARDAAWQHALASEALDRAELLHNVRALSDERALQLAGQRGEALDPLVQLSASDGEARIAAAWDRLVRWRGLVTAELALRRAPSEALADTALARAHAHWLEALRHNARLEVEDAGGGNANAGLEASRAEVEKAERDYAPLAAARGIVRDTASVSLARIRAALASEEALVSIVTLYARTDTARVVAFATLGSAGALRRIDLGRERPLLGRIALWRAALEKPPTPGAEHSEELACRRLGADVRARTWAKLAPLVGDAHAVVLVADGALADLPWGALPEGENRYLVESGPELRTPEAERELLAAPARTGRGLLALGDPDFERGEGARDSASAPAPVFAAAALEHLRGLADDCAADGAFRLPALPGARAEVREIALAWDRAHPQVPATLLVGAAGNERDFKRDAPGHEVLHLATHGIVWGDQCAPLRAGLRGVGGITPIADAVHTSEPRDAARRASGDALAAAATEGLAPSPWSGRRVWLALAGANHGRTSARDENDGLLTADEVVALDLSAVDWVVLSACQSGVGEQWPLEGSVGMRRAFRLAGAHAVIASQWSVADESTREWMRALYAARAAGSVSASAAVRSASRSVLRARRAAGRDTHPFRWAAFTATGD